MASSEDAGYLRVSKLNRDNFQKWKFDVRMLLMHHDVYGLVDGTETIPADKEDNSKEVILWKKRNAKALSTICLLIEDDLKNLVMDCETAKDAWEAVKNVFEPSSRARIASLRAEFMKCRLLPGEPMSIFIGRLLRSAKDLESEGKTIADDEIAFQMLSNLPAHFDNVVMTLYQLSDKEFTSVNIRNALIAEYDRVQHREFGLAAQSC